MTVCDRLVDSKTEIDEVIRSGMQTITEPEDEDELQAELAGLVDEVEKEQKEREELRALEAVSAAADSLPSVPSGTLISSDGVEERQARAEMPIRAKLTVAQ